MDQICHLCARCFDTVEELREHIRLERSRFIRDVHDIFAQPQPSLSCVVKLLLRYATHSTERENEQDLACPEPGCAYVSTESYQGLQRHYMTHVDAPINTRCPFCSKRLKRVSLAVRHPDVCKVRKRRALPITAEIIERKRTLSELAFSKLRLAQRANRRHMLQRIEDVRNIEMDGEVGRGIASVIGTDSSVVPVTTAITASGIASQPHYSDLREDHRRTLGYASSSSEYPGSHSLTLARTNVIGETDCGMLNNNTAHPTQRAAIFASNPTDEVAVYALPTQPSGTIERLSAYEAGPHLNSGSDLLRAATLGSNTADGTAGQHASMTEGIPGYDAAPFPNPNTEFLRAAILGNNTADGAAVYPLPTQHGGMTEGISGYDAASIPPDTRFLRAATLGSNTADGTAGYHASMTEGIPGYDAASFPNPNTEFLRAATLGSNTADGATTYLSLEQQAFVAGVSVSQDELFLDNGAMAE